MVIYDVLTLANCLQQWCGSGSVMIFYLNRITSKQNLTAAKWQSVWPWAQPVHITNKNKPQNQLWIIDDFYWLSHQLWLWQLEVTKLNVGSAWLYFGLTPLAHGFYVSQAMGTLVQTLKWIQRTADVSTSVDVGWLGAHSSWIQCNRPDFVVLCLQFMFTCGADTNNPCQIWYGATALPLCQLQLSSSPLLHITDQPFCNWLPFAIAYCKLKLAPNLLILFSDFFITCLVYYHDFF